MGITGLLQNISPLLVFQNRKCHDKLSHNITQFKNQSIAIDASSWLFKASYSCAEKLVESIESNNVDKQCERIICSYMIKRCEELLLNAQLKRIFIVFDGKRCPLKYITNQQRRDRRQEYLIAARKLKSLGQRKEAAEKYRLCVRVEDWMTSSVMKAVKTKWGNTNHSAVQCVCSPYEADAQLAKLCVDGVADAVVTEDSDVILYSLACGKPFPIIFKLDRHTGNCDVITMDWLLTSSENKQPLQDVITSIHPPLIRDLIDPTKGTENQNESNDGNRKRNNRSQSSGGALLNHLRYIVQSESKEPGSGARMFIQACVLAGCDYAPSRLSGVGLVTAFKLIREQAHRDPDSRFLNVLKFFPVEKIIIPSTDSDEINSVLSKHSLKNYSSSSTEVVENYELLLAQSEAAFYYHIVKESVFNQTAHFLSPPKEGTKLKNIPCIDRFNGDITFLGETELHNKVDYSNKEPLISLSSKPISNVSNPYDKKSIQDITTSRKRKYGAIVSNEKIIDNTNRYHSRQKIYPQEISQDETETNPFSFFAYDMKSTSEKSGPIQSSQTITNSQASSLLAEKSPSPENARLSIITLDSDDEDILETESFSYNRHSADDRPVNCLSPTNISGSTEDNKLLRKEVSKFSNSDSTAKIPNIKSRITSKFFGNQHQGSEFNEPIIIDHSTSINDTQLSASLTPLDDHGFSYDDHDDDNSNHPETCFHSNKIYQPVSSSSPNKDHHQLESTKTTNIYSLKSIENSNKENTLNTLYKRSNTKTTKSQIIMTKTNLNSKPLLGNKKKIVTRPKRLVTKPNGSMNDKKARVITGFFKPISRIG